MVTAWIPVGGKFVAESETKATSVPFCGSADLFTVHVVPDWQVASRMPAAVVSSELSCWR